MKAKDAVVRIRDAQKCDDKYEGAAADRGADECVRCAWEELVRLARLRFYNSRESIDVAVFRHIEQEFCVWCEAVVRQGEFPWLRFSMGKVMFFAFINRLESGANGESIDLSRLDVLRDPEGIVGMLRSGL